MWLSSLFLLLWAALVPLTLARSSTGDAVLVVMEPALKKEDYSIFFQNLEAKGYKLTFRGPNDTQPPLSRYDVPQYSHVIMFAPTTKTFAQDLSPQALVNLMKEQPTANLLVALSLKNTPMSALAAEFALGLPPPNTPIMSHFPHRSTPHTTLIINPPPPHLAHPLLSKNLPPFVFEGQAHLVGDNPMLFPILNAPVESFSSDTTEDRSSDVLVEAADKGGEGLWAGSKMSLVSGFQATTGARATFVGGVRLFSDEFARMDVLPGQQSGNAQLARDLAAWTFQETLVLRVHNATHHLASDRSHTPRDRYTINSQLTFLMEISQYDPASQTYTPKSDIDDMQLDFTMLDPHLRAPLKPVEGKPGLYSLTFRAPDRHGVYKFAVNYKRKGWTSIQVAVPVAIVPPRHNEYPRFLSAAWPYYAGAISTSVGFILFCIVYLGGEAQEERTRTAKGKGKVE